MSDQMMLLPPSDGRETPRAREDEQPWELDEHTRTVGKQGLAAARQALRQATARRLAA